MYCVAYMDRINLGFAVPYMRTSLHLSASQAGLAGSIFFIGYVLPQLFAGRLVARFGARRLIASYMIAWGIMAMATGVVQNYGQLMVVRLLLGLAEGGVYPALLVLLSDWFPSRERGRAISYFLVCIPFGAAVISPFSGLILTHTSWRMLFIMEGALPLIWVVFWLLLISNRPETASWLDDRERSYLRSARNSDPEDQNIGTSLRSALRQRNVVLMVVAYFLLQVGQYGLGIWLPTVIKTASGGTPLAVGLLTALAWAAGAIGLMVNGWHSDRSGERRIHASVPVVIGALLLLTSTVIGDRQVALTLVAIIFAVGFFQSYNGVVWALTSDLAQAAALGAVAGIINGLGTLGGGIAGPYLVGVVTDQTHSALTAQLVLVIALLLAAAILPFVRVQRRLANGVQPVVSAERSADA
jgi:sugar phosphate permease